MNKISCLQRQPRTWELPTRATGIIKHLELERYRTKSAKNWLTWIQTLIVCMVLWMKRNEKHEYRIKVRVVFCSVRLHHDISLQCPSLAEPFLACKGAQGRNISTWQQNQQAIFPFNDPAEFIYALLQLLVCCWPLKKGPNRTYLSNLLECIQWYTIILR